MKRFVHTFLFGILTASCITTTAHAQYWQLRGAPVIGSAPASWFGYAVSLSSDGLTLAASGPNNSEAGAATGYVRVSTWNGSSWIPKGTDIYGINPGESSGIDICLSGDGNTVIIGIPYSGDAGMEGGTVRVFSWDGTDWQQKGDDIFGESLNEYLGNSVAVNQDGSVIAVADTYADFDYSNSGWVQAFSWNGTSWETKGSVLQGNGAQDYFGGDLAIDASGNRLIVSKADSVLVYQWQDTAWTQFGQTLAAPTNINNFGWSVDITGDGQAIAIGAIQNITQPILAGKTYVYYWNNGSWTLRGNPITGEDAGDRSGYSVSIGASGDVVAIGSADNDDGGSNAGSVKIYHWNGSSWTLLGDNIDGEAEEDWSGIAVSLSADGTVVAIGAPNNATGGLEAGYVRVYEAEAAALTEAEELLFRLYPNPAAENVHVLVPGAANELTITIGNTCGQVIRSVQGTGASETVLELPAESGTYFITVQTEGFSSTQKLVKL